MLCFVNNVLNDLLYFRPEIIKLLPTLHALVFAIDATLSQVPVHFYKEKFKIDYLFISLIILVVLYESHMVCDEFIVYFILKDDKKTIHI